MQSTRCPSKALGQTIRCAAARTTLKLMSAQNNPASKQPHRLIRMIRFILLFLSFLTPAA